MKIDAQRRAVFFLRLLLPVILVGLVPFAQAQNAAGTGGVQGKLTVTGSVIMSPLVSSIARRFEIAHPGAKIDVQPGGTGKAVADLRSGATDIGMLARSLRPGERDLFASAIARDGVAIIVHRNNPVKRMDAGQLSGVLTGRLANWKALGGRDAPVNLGWRSKGQGAAQLILDHTRLKREQIGRHVPLATPADSLRFVARDPYAIAIASVGEAEREARAGVPIKLLAYEGVPASARSLQNHTYSLSRPLMLATRGVPQGLQKQFIDYALSSEVVDLQVKYGFVPYQE